MTAICPGIINTPIVQSSPLRGEGATDEARERMVDLYRRRNYGPERVARNILKAVQRNRAVAPVSPEAWLFYYLKRFTPGLVRTFAGWQSRSRATPAREVTDRDAVLAANAAFYDAFGRGDAGAMERLWSERTDVACIHPGWRPLHGRPEVLSSWYSILANQSASGIRCDSAIAYVYGETAMVICTEQLPGGELVATNLFTREGDEWRLVHHQAGPAPPPDVATPSGPVH